MRKSIALAALACLWMMAAQITANAQTLKVAVPHPGLWDSSIINFAVREGYFRDAGVDVEFFYTEGGGSQLQTVISGAVDLGMLNGFLSVISAYSKGAPLRVISAEFTGALDSFWYARSDSGIRTLADAAGKTVAFSSTGSSSHLTILSLLKQAKVTTARPVATGGQLTTLTQVMSGQIDVGFSVPPIGLQELADGKINIIAYGRDALDLRGQTVRVNVANAEALRTKREAITRFMGAIARAIEFGYAEKKALVYFAENAKVSEATALKVREEFYPKSALQLTQMHGVKDALRDAFANKYTAKEMSEADVAGLFDLSVLPK
jgi:NitT/TauT family transport system substrate-binding protein